MSKRRKTNEEEIATQQEMTVKCLKTFNDYFYGLKKFKKGEVLIFKTQEEVDYAEMMIERGFFE
jgi:hypothetical protein